MTGVKAQRTDSEAYQRILGTARDLFYRNGYRATGINEIIDKSGVAKATFYAHFPSKDDLAVAYVKSMNEMEARGIEKALEKFSGPREKLLGLLEVLIPWAESRDYRGCANLNMSSEVTDAHHPVRREARKRYDDIRVLVGGLMADLKAKKGRAWKDRDSVQMTEDYMLMFAGALAMAQIYHDPRPFREAIASAKRLLA